MATQAQLSCSRFSYAAKRAPIRSIGAKSRLILIIIIQLLIAYQSTAMKSQRDPLLLGVPLFVLICDLAESGLKSGLVVVVYTHVACYSLCRSCITITNGEDKRHLNKILGTLATSVHFRRSFFHAAG